MSNHKDQIWISPCPHHQTKDCECEQCSVGMWFPKGGDLENTVYVVDPVEFALKKEDEFEISLEEFLKKIYKKKDES